METYTLIPQERQTLLNLNAATANQKVRIHDLHIQLEQAQKELAAAEALFAGALTMVADAHGMPGAQLSPDFSTLTKEQAK